MNTETSFEAGNRLIARFDDFEIIWGNPSHNCDRHFYLLADEGCSCGVRYDKFTRDGESFFFDEDLKYHTSWDWLKPIVDKIFTYGLAYPEQVREFKKMSIVVDILPCWRKCVKFIEWLNKEQNDNVCDARKDEQGTNS